MYKDLSPADLTTIRAGLTPGESARFTDEQVEARYQYYPDLPELIAVLKDSAARQASSPARSEEHQKRKGGLRLAKVAREPAGRAG